GEAAALAGSVDIVVHDAAVLGPVPMPLLADTACEDLERVLAVNLVGPFRLTRALVGAMALRREGLVLAVSSDASVEAYPARGAGARPDAGNAANAGNEENAGNAADPVSAGTASAAGRRLVAGESR